LADQVASGLTIAEWCRRNAVAGSLFHFWKRTMARRGAGRVGPQPKHPARRRGRLRPETQSAVRTQEPVVFAPVVLAPALPQVHPDRHPASSAIEIVLAGRRVVRVGAGFDAPTLSRVLALLEGRPC
jgi:hypothetical protein